MDQFKIVALGGLDEDGKNMTVFEVNEEIVLVNCGLKYPENEQLGIEIVIPDFTYLVKNKQKVKGIFITHGHDDVMGALPYLIKQVNVPIYATPFTAVLIEDMMKKQHIKDYVIHRIKRFGEVKAGSLSVRTFGMTHSIPDAIGVAINTPNGYVVHPGEFVIDFDMKIPSFSCDITEFAEIGKKGVFLMTAESVGCERAGFTSPRHRITNHIEPIFENSDSRIFVTMYEQNIYRLIEVIELANKYNRKIYFFNKSQRENMRQLEALKYYHMPAGLEISDSQFTNDLENVVVVVAASGPNVFRQMNRIAMGEESTIELRPEDQVIVASPVVPGTEKDAGTMENELYKDNVSVLTLDRKEVLSMHASREDLKMISSLFKPKYYVPIKGEYRQMVENANLALEGGMSAANIVVLDNGQIATFENGRLKTTADLITLEDVNIDGNAHLDTQGLVLRDRQTLSTDGVIIIGIVINHKTKEVIGGPDVQSRGVIYLKDADHIVKEIGKIIESTIHDAVKANTYENMSARMDAKDRVSKFVLKETGKRPMVLPVIIEINI